MEKCDFSCLSLALCARDSQSSRFDDRWGCLSCSDTGDIHMSQASTCAGGTTVDFLSAGQRYYTIVGVETTAPKLHQLDAF